MGTVYREHIENPEGMVLLRIPKELQGSPLEVTLAPTQGVESLMVDLKWDAEYRRTHSVHPSWTPEELALLHQVAGSMPELEEVIFDPDESAEESDWELPD